MMYIPRWSSALAEWLACMVFIFGLRPRPKSAAFWTKAAFFLAVQSAFLIYTGNAHIFWWIPCMCGAVGLMLLFIRLMTDIAVTDAVHYCVNAFVLAELSAALVWQVYWYLGDPAGVPRGTATSAAMLLLTVPAFALEKRLLSRGPRLAVSGGELAGAVLIAALVFAFSNIGFVPVTTPFSGTVFDVWSMRTLIDLWGFAVLYAHHVNCCQTRARRELEAVQNVLNNQYLQYQQSRESIEIINRKYHDLKHQINALRLESDPVKRGAWLDEMESGILAYEAGKKTGNPVLDTILMSKSLRAHSLGIIITCVADGKLLEFMDVMDVCAVFGNALDNAIEYLAAVPDNEKRLIHMTVSRERGFLLMRFENYCESEPRFENGLPVTTKTDKDFHGFGLKNIRHTAKKYGGSASAEYENSWFSLNVLLPLERV
ncbi:MAG: GHKL domain-containing protein [Clostridiales bacterium]|jgi:hypothetical protein|nr:GHKL domain-containing protein [Clostridiales bacterium]